MLTLLKNSVAIPTDDYCITHKESGLDELAFSIKTSTPLYAQIDEEDRIYETTEGIFYIVKAISAGDGSADYKCQIDLDEWKGTILGTWGATNTSWSVTSKTAAEVVTTAATAAGWTVSGNTTKTERRSIAMDGPSPLEVASEAMEVFGCRLRFNNSTKVVTIVYPADATLSNSYVARSVNLKSISYTGKSTDFATRLYAVGKNGLTFASINNNKPYVENTTWSNKVVCAFWKDERYEVAANLLADATTKLAELAIPARTWKCNVIDLYSIDGTRWPDMALTLFKVIKVQDDEKGVTLSSQIIEDDTYPYYPEKNSVVISTASANVQKTVSKLNKLVNNRNSALWQIINAR